MRIIAHVDMDAFYASVEGQANPALRDRPVVVGADPKVGHGRGVVTAASYAARRYGIRSAMPISRAWRLAEAARARGEPEAVFIRDNHALYREVSARIMTIVASGADAFEEASIDEAYLDLSSLESFAAAAAHARVLKSEIRRREGLTCSVGIGPNKLVAKVASDFQKPDGLTVVELRDVLDFLGPLPIRVIPGIGPKTAGVLHQRGIRTVADLRGVERQELVEAFGRWGEDPLRQGAGDLRQPGVQRVGAEVRRRAGDVRGRHARARIHSRAGTSAGTGGLRPSPARGIPRLPDGYRHRAIHELPDAHALAHAARAPGERRRPLHRRRRSAAAVPRRPRESPPEEGATDRGARGEADALTVNPILVNLVDRALRVHRELARARSLCSGAEGA